jgi:hypothetical protein
MNKKIMKVSFIFLIVVLVTNTAFADFNVFMVSSERGTEKYTFDWNETPWLYLSLPYSGLNVTASWWEAPVLDGNLFYFVGSGPSSNQEIWLSLDSGVDAFGNPIDWFDVRQIGEWHITVGYFYADGSLGTASTRFTVTPEPIGSILFITGGATLAIKYYLRRRKKI